MSAAIAPPVQGLSPPESVSGFRILGVDVAALTREQALQKIGRMWGSGERTRIAFANTNLLNATTSDVELRNGLSSFLVLNDGIGVDIASLLLHGVRFPDNLNGTDFTPLLLARFSKARVFLYGARPEIVAEASRRLVERGVILCGALDGYGADSTAAVAAANASGAEIMLVALGNPRQERWVLRHSADIHAPVVVCVGAFFDFIAGAHPRAPVWMRRVGLEWSFRLFREPRRLARRYTFDIGRFCLALIGEKLAKFREVKS